MKENFFEPSLANIKEGGGAYSITAVSQQGAVKAQEE